MFIYFLYDSIIFFVTKERVSNILYSNLKINSNGQEKLSPLSQLFDLLKMLAILLKFLNNCNKFIYFPDK